MRMLENAWYDGSRWPLLLWPLEKLFICLSQRRRKQQSLQQWISPVPLIVVGNINVGGTGKSPLVIALIQWLRDQGYRPGVVSRGYTANPGAYPFSVTEQSSVEESGDEPLMIVQRTQVPMVIDPDRVRACQHLLKIHNCNIIISDDGLQHYAMGRDIEIVVIDGKRGLGNGHCLPVGPLRELPERLGHVDMLIVNGAGGYEHSKAITMQLAVTGLVSLKDGQRHDVSMLVNTEVNTEVNTRVHAVAGIGNPGRFYNTLRQAGLRPIEHSFPDHHLFQLSDITFDDALPVIMTEKDAVKCALLPLSAPAYYLQVDAQLPAKFSEQLMQLLQNVKESETDG
ncbi:tetraacyldisaccharide 4'-kinase [Neptunomonas qingdaonensis]|uniref:Tetraacyldisaccharide 4'-kinase n=1 Tax=Neptunomonas qingdaonensis TaxID=1045558 RepID=A0A1I2RLV5_9GAMM|nr:tetraacyldisaccharide 4'-kinase [Neptunomonas qingdaonensis]SFG41644.1 lipid-A-disaccharide kinase [Neptunomonas qingdaonensis]